MTDLHRIADDHFKDDDDCPAPLWTAVEDAVEEQFKVRPFSQIKDLNHPKFFYLQSKQRRERFEILSQHHRFKSEVERSSPTDCPSELGPVEVDIWRFLRLTQPHLAVLVGGMGGGKSTTLRYVLNKYNCSGVAIYCDLDPNIEVSVETTAWAARILSQYLSPEISKLIGPNTQFTSVWTWAMSIDDGHPHHARYVLADAQTILQRELEGRWLDESSEAIAIRKKAHESIHKDPQEFLSYLALLVDYYLSVTCKGDRGRFTIVLDNVDPLPPRLQYEILRCASRFQESAQCKLLVAMRPMTYSKNLQAANRTVSVIEHLGPEALELIESRINTLVLAADLSKVQVKVRDDESRELLIGEPEARYWIEQILAVARQGTFPHREQNSARQFIEGVCNNSLRSALILAPKLFTSSAIPFVLQNEPGGGRSLGLNKIRAHDLVRAAMIGRKSCFRSNQGRVIDNIFDLGREATKQSVTCKLRLLKRLDAADNGVLTIEQLRDHLAIFDIPDESILDGINSIIAQTKRLAWSDSLTRYDSFADAPASRIQIADAGRFYVRAAINSLEYVQESHLDAPVPTSALIKEYSTNRFSDRITALRLFLQHLHDKDKREVLIALAMQKGLEYYTTYSDMLISTSMIASISRQVNNVGRSILAGKIGQMFRSEIEAALGPWIGIEQWLEREDADILSKLRTFSGVAG